MYRQTHHFVCGACSQHTADHMTLLNCVNIIRVAFSFCWIKLGTRERVTRFNFARASRFGLALVVLGDVEEHGLGRAVPLSGYTSRIPIMGMK